MAKNKKSKNRHKVLDSKEYAIENKYDYFEIVECLYLLEGNEIDQFIKEKSETTNV